MSKNENSESTENSDSDKKDIRMKERDSTVVKSDKNSVLENPIRCVESNQKVDMKRLNDPGLLETSV